MRNTTSDNRRKPVPLFASEVEKEYVQIPAEFFPSLTDGFIVTVDGNGMANAGIHSGDLLVMDTEVSAQSGDIVVASLQEQFLCRRVFFEDNKVRLRREDGSTPDVITSDCIIRGVMVGLIRNVRERPMFC